jgi:hypothetical protein
MTFSAQAQTKQPEKAGMPEISSASLYYEVAGEGQSLELGLYQTGMD